MTREHHRPRRRRAADGIVTRPQPRVAAGTDGNRNVAAVILAAGRSSRMGGPNKLLETLHGKPLVRIVTEQALASRAKPVIVVTGHQGDKVRAELKASMWSLPPTPTSPTASPAP